MLKPPLSQSIARPTPSNSPHVNEPSPNTALTSIRYILPASVKSGNTLARRIYDVDGYYVTELVTRRLDRIRSYLWLAGLPSSARPLHRQQLLGREVVLTEDPNEHLVWHRKQIYIKPLPLFLLDIDCWTQKLCKTEQLHQAACGFLLSYAWLIRHEIDCRIACAKGLLPESLDWETWTALVDDFLEHIDLQSLNGVSFRYQYGELRLSRLNKIYRITRFTSRDIIRGYMTTSTWYQDFFTRNFAWLLAVFAVASVALSAMQVVLAVGTGGKPFADASYGFSIASLFLVAGTALVVLLLWIILFAYHLASARENNQKVMLERRNCAESRSEP